MKTTQLFLPVFILLSLTCCVKSKTTIDYPLAIDKVVAGLKSSLECGGTVY